MAHELAAQPPPAPLAGAVTEKHAALGAVWAHREEFKRFSLHVGAPALRAYAALLSWAPQALAQAGLQQNADACLAELARVRQATARAAL